MRHLVWIEVDETSLRSCHHEPGLRNREPTGPQAIAVENGANQAAVRESDRRRTVPRFRAVGVIPQKRRGVAGGRSRRQNHAHRFGQCSAIVRDQFHGLVERGGVGSALRQNRLALDRKRGVARRHTGAVAPHRIDLSVVSEGAAGLCAVPGGKGVGGVALMKDCERGNVVFEARSG